MKPRPGTKGPFVLGGGFTRDKRPPPYISPFPPPSSNTWSVLDLRLARAAAVPCAHRLLLTAIVVPEHRRPPPPEDAPTELRRPTAPSVPSSAIPERRPTVPSSPISDAPSPNPERRRRPSSPLAPVVHRRAACAVVVLDLRLARAPPRSCRSDLAPSCIR